MAAYIYGNIEITDPALYEQYRAEVPAVIAAHGGRYLVRGGATHDEFVRSFSAEPDVIGFAHLMCAERGAVSAYASRHAAFCAALALDRGDN